MKLISLAALLLPLLSYGAESGAQAPTEAADTAPAAEVAPQEEKTVMHNGQLFTLAGSSSARNVQTEEYVLRGEKLSDWTQLLTMQRLTLEAPSTPDEFTAFFKKKVSAEGGARFEILQQGKSASVFAVHFAKSELNEEQVMVCLIMADKPAGSSLNLIQYALKPNRLAADVVGAQLKSWKARFIQQALASK